MLFPFGVHAQLGSPPADAHIQGVAIENGVQPQANERAASALSLPLDMKFTCLTSAANPRPDVTGSGVIHVRDEKSGESAFIRAPELRGKQRIASRDRVALILLSLAVHSAVTWDAQSTNHFFRHCPSGYRPVEVDPVMRPFAGTVAIYPMANLLFAAPFDLLLYRTRHGQKLTRVLSKAAASAWVGMEIQQSVVNIRHEHLNGR